LDLGRRLRSIEGCVDFHGVEDFAVVAQGLICGQPCRVKRAFPFWIRETNCAKKPVDHVRTSSASLAAGKMRPAIRLNHKASETQNGDANYQCVKLSEMSSKAEPLDQHLLFCYHAN
jgi:hypothetical protein